MNKLLSLILLCMCLLLMMLGCTPSHIENIDESDGVEMESIYISHTTAGKVGATYKVDLQNGKLWIYMVRSNYQYQARNSSAPNEGFYFVKDLDQEKITAFLLECGEYGLETWEEDYTKEMALDPHYWSVRIVYSDGTEKESHGENEYPNTWGQMAGAFERLTGFRLLKGSPPEPSFWFFGRPVYWW